MGNVKVQLRDATCTSVSHAYVVVYLETRRILLMVALCCWGLFMLVSCPFFALAPGTRTLELAMSNLLLCFILFFFALQPSSPSYAIRMTFASSFQGNFVVHRQHSDDSPLKLHLGQGNHSDLA